MAGNVETQNKTKRRLNNWLLEYSYWYTWEEFSKTRQVDVNTTRDFVQWILTQVDQNSADYNTVMKSLILGALCLLSDGSDYSIRYSGDSDLTVLEVFLKTFQNICEQVPFGLRQKFLDFIPAIKLQAVLVCCEKGDFQNGWKVFERQWESSTSDEALKRQISTVLKFGSLKDSVFKKNTYDVFLDKIFSLLKKINNSFNQPFLITLAKQMEQVDEVNLGNKPTVGLKRSYQASDLEKAANTSVEKYSKLSHEEEISLREKLIQIREAKISSFIARGLSESKRSYKEDTDSDSMKDFDTGQGNANSSAHNRSLDNDVDKEERERRQSLKTRLNNNDGNLRKALDIIKKPVQQSLYRRKWQKLETEEFYKAVQKYGVGHWAEIKDYLKSFRSNVKLKDKWRTIQNTGEIEELKKKFGPA